MSSSTTNGARQARLAWCSCSASPSSSSSSAVSFRSIACWGKNEEFLARPLPLRRVLRAGAALFDPADPDHRADVVVERPLPNLPAAIAVAALVSGLSRRSLMDAGDAGDADRRALDRRNCNAARRGRGV